LKVRFQKRVRWSTLNYLIRGEDWQHPLDNFLQFRSPDVPHAYGRNQLLKGFQQKYKLLHRGLLLDFALVVL